MAHAYTIDLTSEDRDYLQSLTRQRTIQELLLAEGLENLMMFFINADMSIISIFQKPMNDMTLRNYACRLLLHRYSVHLI